MIKKKRYNSIRFRNTTLKETKNKTSAIEIPTGQGLAEPVSTGNWKFHKNTFGYFREMIIKWRCAVQNMFDHERNLEVRICGAGIVFFFFLSLYTRPATNSLHPAAECRPCFRWLTAKLRTDSGFSPSKSLLCRRGVLRELFLFCIRCEEEEEDTGAPPLFWGAGVSFFIRRARQLSPKYFFFSFYVSATYKALAAAAGSVSLLGICVCFPTDRWCA